MGADEKGAPADFSGRVIPNDNDVKPKWDTDEPEGTYHAPKGYKLDISNPPAADISPHPLHEHFEKKPRVQMGAHLQKGHPALKVSDN